VYSSRTTAGFLGLSTDGYSVALVGMRSMRHQECGGDADESFEMNVGAKDSFITHSNVVDFVCDDVFSSTRKRPECGEQWFDLDKLTPEGSGVCEDRLMDL